METLLEPDFASFWASQSLIKNRSFAAPSMPFWLSIPSHCGCPHTFVCLGRSGIRRTQPDNRAQLWTRLTAQSTAPTCHWISSTICTLESFGGRRTSWPLPNKNFPRDRPPTSKCPSTTSAVNTRSVHHPCPRRRSTGTCHRHGVPTMGACFGPCATLSGRVTRS